MKKLMISALMVSELVIFSMPLKADTKDFGTYGEVFPIQEKSLLEVIKSKLQALFDSGKIEEHQKIILDKTKEKIKRPSPVEGIVKTVKERSFTYDPSITLPYDLKDHQGQIFHSAGTRINPLETHQLRHPLLFIDGDDETQVTWALRQLKEADLEHKPKVILVKGTPLELSEKLKEPVYFDQSGRLVKKLGITQVPARVSEKDKVLAIEEIEVKS